jgi:hypothetical protein
MTALSSSLDYRNNSKDIDDSPTNGISESEMLRNQVRQRCNDVLNRLFPEHGKDSLGDWNQEDVFELSSIFELARVARHAETEKPLMSKHTILRVLNKLATGGLFHDHGDSSLFEMEDHLRLLSAVLRLYKYEGTSLTHNIRDALYNGLNELRASFDDDRRNCPSEKQIENMNVAFLLQHCQYLLVSIKDSESLGTTIANRFFLGVDAVLSTYGSQFVEAKQNIRDIAKYQRSRPKWHDEFMRLEDICFSIYARKTGLEMEAATNKTESEREIISDEERDTALIIRDSLEDVLVTEPSRMYKFLEGWQKGLGRITQRAFSSGSYEENPEYFKYGVLDLLYQLSYRMQDRNVCFPEFIGVIKLILERSHKSANSLHRKAIDLYRRINELGKEDDILYGSDCERQFIDEWYSQHHHEIEPDNSSSKYALSYYILIIDDQRDTLKQPQKSRT